MFNHPTDGYIVRKPMGFFAVSAMGLSAVLVTAILSATGIALYGIRVVDKKTDNLNELVQEAKNAVLEIQATFEPVRPHAGRNTRSPRQREAPPNDADRTQEAASHGCQRTTISINKSLQHDDRPAVVAARA